MCFNAYSVRRKARDGDIILGTCILKLVQQHTRQREHSTVRTTPSAYDGVQATCCRRIHGDTVATIALLLCLKGSTRTARDPSSAHVDISFARILQHHRHHVCPTTRHLIGCRRLGLLESLTRSTLSVVDDNTQRKPLDLPSASHLHPSIQTPERPRPVMSSPTLSQPDLISLFQFVSLVFQSLISVHTATTTIVKEDRPRFVAALTCVLHPRQADFRATHEDTATHGLRARVFLPFTQGYTLRILWISETNIC